MKHLSKTFATLALFSFPAAMALFSTDVYLINRLNFPLIRGPINKVVGKFARAADQSQKKSWMKINPGKKKKIFSIPRILGPESRFHEKSTNIKKEGSGKHGMILEVWAERKTVFHPTKIDAYWSGRSYLTLKKKLVFKFGKLYKELHITALPRKNVIKP